MRHHSRRIHYFYVPFCLLIMLSACGTLAGNGTSSTPSPTKTSRQFAVSPTTTTEQTVTAQTCPAAGDARAAVMPSMTVGHHASVVFLAQQSESTLLQRYDVTTGATKTILQVQQGEPSLGTNISPDGQWIVFGGLLQGQSAIQLVRMDGQQLQTLYCAPPQTNVSSLILSPDQHYLVFSQLNSDLSESILYLLDMRTGKLQTELSTLQPDYPVFGQYATQSSSLSMLPSPFFHSNEASDGLPAQPSYPLGSNNYPMYVPMKWATSRSVYLLGEVAASPSPPPQLVLLRDITKGTSGNNMIRESLCDSLLKLLSLRESSSYFRMSPKGVSQQGSNVQPVIVTPNANNCQDIDVTADNRQIVCSSFAQFGPTAPSSVMLQFIAGDTFHSIYSDPAGGPLNARALSNPSIIIFTLYRRNEPPALFKINSDGSGFSQLMAGATTETLLNLAASYLPWSNASRDSTLYALQLYDLATDKQTLVYGHMSGGAPVTFASSSNELDIVGWTEL